MLSGFEIVIKRLILDDNLSELYDGEGPCIDDYECLSGLCTRDLFGGPPYCYIDTIGLYFFYWYHLFRQPLVDSQKDEMVT
jgi:hypothetical protein